MIGRRFLRRGGQQILLNIWNTNSEVPKAEEGEKVTVVQRQDDK